MRISKPFDILVKDIVGMKTTYGSMHTSIN